MSLPITAEIHAWPVEQRQLHRAGPITVADPAIVFAPPIFERSGQGIDRPHDGSGLARSAGAG